MTTQVYLFSISPPQGVGINFEALRERVPL